MTYSTYPIGWIKTEGGKAPLAEVPVWVYSAATKLVVMAEIEEREVVRGTVTKLWIQSGGPEDMQIVRNVTHYVPIIRPEPPQEE